MLKGCLLFLFLAVGAPFALFCAMALAFVFPPIIIIYIIIWMLIDENSKKDDG